MIDIEKNLKVEKISSKDNLKYKSYLKLSQKKYRQKEEKVIIEGATLIEEAIESNVEIDSIILREGYLESLEKTANTKEEFYYSKCKNLLEKVVDFNKKAEFERGKKIKIILLSSMLFLNLVETEHSRGIIAVINFKISTCDNINEDVNLNNNNFLLLDRIQDPGNFGTMIRTALGAGFRGILMMKGTCDPLDAKVIRAAAGGIFRLPIYFVENLEELLSLKETLGYKIVSTGFNTKDYYFDISLKEKKIIVIGNEGRGVSQEILENSEKIIKIPMENGLESLNASVAASIIMYHALEERLTYER